MKMNAMKKLTGIFWVMTALLLTLTLGCNKEEEGALDSFQAVVDNGGGFMPTVENESTEVSEVYNEERDGKTWECTTETVSIQMGAGGNEGFSLFSPNASVIYPGNLLQGNSLNQGTPNIIAVERAGGTISTDVVDGNIQSSFEVEQITKSAVTDAINNIISTSTGIVPANFSLTIRNVQSRQQFALALGLDVNTTFTDIEAKLNYNSDVSRNSFLVNLQQSFYTMSFDIPTSLDQLFAPSVTPEDLARYVGPDNPAAYISDVTYGRVYFMMIQSTSTTTEMNAAINAAFNGITAQVDGSVETNYLAGLSDLSISVFAYGGLASSSLLTVGTSDLQEIAQLLAESSNIGSGKPISYVVRSVYDNQIVSTQLATQYDVTNCVPTGADGAPPYTKHWTGEVVSAMGPVGAAYNTYGTEFILINQDGDQWMRSRPGLLEGPFPLDELGTGPCPLQGGIGAACNLDGNANGDFYLMAVDKLGVNFTYMNPSGVWSSNPPQPISNLANGSGPFNLAGIGAMAFRHKDPLGPSSRYMFNSEGDRYSAYLNNPQSFGTVYNTWQWGPDNTIPFDKVGAAIGFFIGDDLFHIHFNDLGTQYSIYGNVDGTGNRFIGPFDL